MNLKFEKKNAILLICVMGIIILWVAFWMSKKQGYRNDELWSMVIANCDRHGLIPEELQKEAGESNWISGTFFWDSISIGESEKFDFQTVVKNVSEDPHPILYYFLLHTVSSLFPNCFSQWFGLLPNLFFLIITLLFMYQIGRRLFQESKYLPLVPLLIWGMSAACVNDVIFIRMYMAETMFYVLMTYIFIVFIMKETLRIFDYALLYFAVIGGMLTDYTFLPFMGLLGVFYIIFLLFNKETKQLLKIAVNITVMFCIVILFYSSYFKVMIIELLSGMSDGAYADKILKQSQNARIFYDYFNNLSFAGHIKIILLIWIILRICDVFYKKYDIVFHNNLEYVLMEVNKKEVCLKEKANSKTRWQIKITKKLYAILSIIISWLVTFFVVTRAANWNDIFGTRTIYPLFPTAIIIITFFIYYKLIYLKPFFKLGSFCIIFLLSILSFFKTGIIWTNPNQQEAAEYAGSKQRDLIWLYYPEVWSDIYTALPVLENCNEIYFLNIYEIKEVDIVRLINNRLTKDTINVCFQAADFSPYDEKLAIVKDMALKAGYTDVVEDPNLGKIGQYSFQFIE